MGYWPDIHRGIHDSNMVALLPLFQGLEASLNDGLQRVIEAIEKTQLAEEESAVGERSETVTWDHQDGAIQRIRQILPDYLHIERDSLWGVGIYSGNRKVGQLVPGSRIYTENDIFHILSPKGT